jgi:general stress protein YciG
MSLAHLPPERRRLIAAMGARAQPAEARFFARSPEAAKEAGRRGGQATQRKRKALLELAPAM